MRIWFVLSGDQNTPSARFRAYQYLPFLEQNGIGYDLLHSDGTSYTLSERMRVLIRADLVFVQKRMLSTQAMMLLRFLRKPVVFDFDDAIFLGPRKGGGNEGRSAVRRSWLKRILRLSKLVIAGNDYLREYAGRYSRRVVVLPTPVDTNVFVRREKVRGPQTVIGWIGTAGNLAYVREIAAVLRRLQVKYRDKVVFRVISSDELTLPGVVIQNEAWSAKQEVAALQGFDIGIMPLPDDPWTRGKCGFKLLQYMAVGIPVVCSPVGMNVKLVRNEDNGFLAASPDEWITALSRLVEDRSLRTRLGENGRTFVEQSYSTDVVAPEFLRLLAGCVRERTGDLRLLS